MGRPLRGTCTPQGDGWRAELPTVSGARQRTAHLFREESDARRWLHFGILALDAGRPLPLPPRSQLARVPRGFGVPQVAAPVELTRTGFNDVGTPWADEYCIDLQKVGSSRETTLRGTIRIIDDWMNRNACSVEQMHRPQVLRLYRFFAGHESGDDVICPHIVVPVGLDPDARVTFREALELPGLSGKRSTLQRAKRAGTLKPSLNAAGVQAFRIGDVYAAAGKLPSDATDIKRGRPRSTDGYVQDVVSDKVWTFKQVMSFAREALHVDVPTDWETLPVPKSVKGSHNVSNSRSVASLGQTTQVAGQLHVVHQLVLWLLRILGVRVSEAFGVRVSDVLDYGAGEPGLVWVHRQGGRRFGTRDPQTGQITNSDSVDATKRSSSNRVLVVPPTLMTLIRCVIAVFHTGADGVVRRDARLVPGLKKADSGGQAAFRSALRSVIVRLRLPMAAFHDDGEFEDYFTPHDMRRSVLSELSYGDGDAAAQRRFAGHAAGDDVHARHYLLDDPLLTRMREIATELESDIGEQVGTTLQIPTRVRCTTGVRANLAPDAARIDAALIEAGWLATLTDDDGQQLLGTPEVALRLGVTPKTARDWMREGELDAIQVEASDGPTWLATLDAVEATRIRRDRATVNALADELGKEPYVVRQLIAAQDWPLDEAGERFYAVPEGTAQLVRDHVARQDALHRRAIPVSGVAGVTGLTVGEIDRLIKNGKLELDERAHDGSRMITRHSVSAMKTGSPDPSSDDLVDRAVAAQLLACGQARIADLISAGVLQKGPLNRDARVTRTSLIACLTANGVPG